MGYGFEAGAKCLQSTTNVNPESPKVTDKCKRNQKEMKGKEISVKE